MGAQDHDYGCGLWEVVNQFVADTNLHPTSPDLTNGPRTQPSQRHRGGSFSPLNLQSATGAHERVEVPARKLGLTTIFCSAQAAVLRPARTGPMPVTSLSRSGSTSIVSNTFSPKARTSFLA